MEKKNGFKGRKHKVPYVFCLYVTGASPNSSRAISNIKGLCENHLKNEYELNIIDVYQQPGIAQTVDIIALPLLIRKNPLPERRLIGDLADKERVIRSLDMLNHEE